jgi:hypothetical protein
VPKLPWAKARRAGVFVNTDAAVLANGADNMVHYGSRLGLLTPYELTQRLVEQRHDTVTPALDELRAECFAKRAPKSFQR